MKIVKLNSHMAFIIIVECYSPVSFVMEHLVFQLVNFYYCIIIDAVAMD